MRALICFFSILSLLSGCQKYNVSFPDFDVSVEPMVYHVGDSIDFNFQGNADYITFYSGEQGHEYEHRDRTELEGGIVSMSFSSMVEFGTQQRNLQVWISNDFSGVYTAESIDAASWTDITDRFAYATVAAVYTASGVHDISDVLLPLTPFYIAFKYVGQPPSGQRTWRVSNFSLQASYPTGISKALAVQTTAGWSFVNVANPNNAWAFTGNDIIFRPNAATIYSEDWAITAAFNPDKVDPDRGVPVKNFVNNRMERYKYAYSEPGEYRVTFVAANSEVYGHQEVVKEITIQIEP